MLRTTDHSIFAGVPNFSLRYYKNNSNTGILNGFRSFRIKASIKALTVNVEACMNWFFFKLSVLVLNMYIHTELQVMQVLGF